MPFIRINILGNKRNPIIFLLLAWFFTACTSPKTSYTLKVGERKIIEGLFSREQMEETIKENWLSNNNQKYQPDITILKSLETMPLDSLSFLVFAGNWCTDTHEHLPAFLKVVDQLNWSQKPATFCFLDLKKKSRFINTEVFQIISMPTFIVLKNGKEIGRIIEKPNQSIEKDLIGIIGSTR